jgi:hypothetical protein
MAITLAFQTAKCHKMWEPTIPTDSRWNAKWPLVLNSSCVEGRTGSRLCVCWLPTAKGFFLHELCLLENQLSVNGKDFTQTIHGWFSLWSIFWHSFLLLFDWVPVDQRPVNTQSAQHQEGRKGKVSRRVDRDKNSDCLMIVAPAVWGSCTPELMDWATS